MLYYNKELGQPIIPQSATIIYGSNDTVDDIYLGLLIVVLFYLIYIIYKDMMKSESYTTLKPPYNDYENVYAPYSLGRSPKR